MPPELQTLWSVSAKGTSAKIMALVRQLCAFFLRLHEHVCNALVGSFIMHFFVIDLEPEMHEQKYVTPTCLFSLLYWTELTEPNEA